MANQPTLQNQFLQELVKEKINVSVFLVNGIKLHGIVDSFDADVIMLRNSVTQMVFKHAISTVVPSRMVNVSGSEEKQIMAD